MLGRRMVYGVVLVATLALQVVYHGYLAQFLLVCAIALPLLSLALGVGSVWGLHLTLTPSHPRRVRGETGLWQMAAHPRSFLPVARLTVALEVKNALTGDTRRQRLVLAGPSLGMAHTLPMDTAHCGQLICTLQRVRALDPLGLFALPVPTPQPAHALVLPRPVPPHTLPPVPPLFEGLSHPLGHTPSGEEYELRDYRPGDPLRTIHWKLSAKHHDLVVREAAGGHRPQVALTVELFGEGDRLDRVLDRLWTLAKMLLERDAAVHLLWTDRQNTPQEAVVDAPAQLEAALARLLAQPAPRRPVPTPLSTSLSQVSITAGEEESP